VAHSTADAMTVADGAGQSSRDVGALQIPDGIVGCGGAACAPTVVEGGEVAADTVTVFQGGGGAADVGALQMPDVKGGGGTAYAPTVVQVVGGPSASVVSGLFTPSDIRWWWVPAIVV
jgi:hypothetical protein